MTMDPSMNQRHAQIHSGDLHRRAELHRLAAKARAAERGSESPGRSGLHLCSLANGIRATVARVRTMAAGDPALGTKTDEAQELQQEG
jgi:hypothetical protein